MKQHAAVVDSTPTAPTQRAGLTIHIDRHGREVRLAVTGELDLATQDLLYAAAADVLQPPVRAFLLDLGGVSFCGAAGVTSLMAVRSLAANGEIRIVLTGVQPAVRRVFDVLGVSTLIPIAHTRMIERVVSDGDVARPQTVWRRPRFGRRARAA
jgi:anti-anti-sigma factor